MPVEQARPSLEPLLPGSRDERYSDASDNSIGGHDQGEVDNSDRASLASLDDVPRMNRGLGQMVPTGRDKAAFWVILTGLILFLGGTVFLILLSSPSQLGYFAPHAPLNATGITCFALGIFAVQAPTPPAGIRAARLAVHQRILLGFGLPAMAVGTSFMWYNKHVHDAPHYTTWHSWAGCTTLLWMIAQALVGGASVWFGGRALGGGMKAKAVYKYHRISGYGLIAFALLTATLGGGYSTWASARLPVLRFFAYGVGAPLVLLGLAMRARPDKMRIR